MKYLLVDMDGSICEYHDPIGGKITMTEFPPGFFLNKRPLNSIIKVIQEQYQDYTKIIFSASPSEEADKEKLQWLQNHGLSDWLHIFLRYPNSDKGQALMNFMRLNNISPSQVYILDDDLRVLKSCEKLGVHCIHPSHFLAEYEEKQVAQHN